MYRLTGDLTFSNNSARNSAQTAVQTEIDARADATAWAGPTYPAGLVRGGTGQLTVGYSVSTEALAVELQAAILTAIATWPRSAGHLAISLGSD